jgi:hypothetical protein
LIAHEQLAGPSYAASTRSRGWGYIRGTRKAAYEKLKAKDISLKADLPTQHLVMIALKYMSY